MKLDIVYSKDREDKIQNVKYITIFRNKLYYFVGDNPSVCIVDLKDILFYSIIE